MNNGKITLTIVGGEEQHNSTIIMTAEDITCITHVFNVIAEESINMFAGEQKSSIIMDKEQIVVTNNETSSISLSKPMISVKSLMIMENAQTLLKMDAAMIMENCKAGKGSAGGATDVAGKVTEVGTKLTNVAQTVTQGITGTINQAVSGGLGGLSNLTSGLGNLTSGLSNTLGQGLSGITGSFGGAIQGVLGKVSGATGLLNGGLGNLTSGLGNMLGQGLSGITEKATGVLGEATQGILGNVSDLTGKFNLGGNFNIGGVVTSAPEFLTNVGSDANLTKNITGTIGNDVSGVLNKGIDMVNNVTNSISNAITPVTNVIQQGTQFIQKGTAAISNGVDAVTQVTNKALNGATNIISNGIQTVSNFANKITKPINSIVNKAIGTVTDISNNAMNKITGIKPNDIVKEIDATQTVNAEVHASEEVTTIYADIDIVIDNSNLIIHNTVYAQKDFTDEEKEITYTVLSSIYDFFIYLDHLCNIIIYDLSIYIIELSLTYISFLNIQDYILKINQIILDYVNDEHNVTINQIIHDQEEFKIQIRQLQEQIKIVTDNELLRTRILSCINTYYNNNLALSNNLITLINDLSEIKFDLTELIPSDEEEDIFIINPS